MKRDVYLLSICQDGILGSPAARFGRRQKDLLERFPSCLRVELLYSLKLADTCFTFARQSDGSQATLGELKAAAAGMIDGFYLLQAFADDSAPAFACSTRAIPLTPLELQWLGQTGCHRAMILLPSPSSDIW